MTFDDRLDYQLRVDGIPEPLDLVYTARDDRCDFVVRPFESSRAKIYAGLCEMCDTVRPVVLHEHRGENFCGDCAERYWGSSRLYRSVT